MTERLPDFRPRFSTTWAPPISATQRLEDERDAARNDLATAERRIAHLEAVNAVLLRIFADALGHTLPTTTTAKGYADAQGRPVGGQITVTPIDGDAGCPVGECVHPATSHEPDEYAADGAPVRPVCCVGGCPCGQQWRAPM